MRPDLRKKFDAAANAGAVGDVRLPGYDAEFDETGEPMFHWRHIITAAERRQVYVDRTHRLRHLRHGGDVIVEARPVPFDDPDIERLETEIRSQLDAG